MQKLHDDGHHVPAIDERPEVGPWFMYYRIFEDLTTCRAWGEIPGPIPWTAINEYCKRHDFNNVDFKNVNFVIRALDNEYLNAWHNKRKQEILKNGRSTANNTNSRRL